VSAVSNPSLYLLPIDLSKENKLISAEKTNRSGKSIHLTEEKPRMPSAIGKEIVTQY
jgi:hypothetical protein